jgi:hypothetical protein
MGLMCREFSGARIQGAKFYVGVNNGDQKLTVAMIMAWTVDLCQQKFRYSRRRVDYGCSQKSVETSL